MRALELRRHAERAPDADGLSPEGQRHAEAVGRNLPGGYAAVYTSPAKRAAETVAWFLRGLGQPLPEQHAVVEGLGSPVEDRWRGAAKAAGSSRIDAIERQDPDLVRQETRRLAAVARELLGSVPDGGRGLAVSHTPLIEATVYGLAGTAIEPLGECDGVLLEEQGGQVRLAEEYRGR
ncbi:MAG TPA: histidine phosphatase family protein [Actinomycetota bacterium]|nr:histidine phosphatase family protein [Actinomycetota bacterium]